MTLRGAVVWVTGGGRGVGRAIAVELAARGARVLVTGRTERALGETVGEIVYQGGTARHLVSDVRDLAAGEAAAARALELWGRLDVVVASARVGGPAPLTADDPARSLEILTTNLLGTFQTFRAAARAMNGPGQLVALSSELATVGRADHGACCASQAGVLGLVRALALELGPRQIRVNAVTTGRGGSGALAEDATDELARFVAAVAGAGDAVTGQALSPGGSAVLGG